MPLGLLEGEKGYLRALMDGDEEKFQRGCVEVLGYDPTDAEGWPLLLAYTRLVTRPGVVDEPFRYTKAYAREAVAFLVRHGRKVIMKEGDPLPNLPKPIDMPPDHTFMNRLQWGLASILGGLEAENNWRAIGERWVREPAIPT
jgi:hypothetical protein